MPAGVTSATFDVYGAAGGDSPAIGFLPGGAGGGGGHVQATVALTPGVTLNLRVGGQGDDGFASPNPFDGTLTAAGGFNGGGTTSDTCSGCAFLLGGAGGGASDVRSAGDGLADRLLVAGGGGGAGTWGDGGDSATAGATVSGSLGGPPITCSGGAGGRWSARVRRALARTAKATTLAVVQKAATASHSLAQAAAAAAARVASTGGPELGRRRWLRLPESD